ncbi:MAG: SDR family NAD(P)-dependent oxidoreductase [Bacillota bacterium]
MGRLAGKTALVTGGGSGVGKAVTELFASEEARVLAVDIDLPSVQEVERKLRYENREVFSARVDISKVADVRQMVDMAVDRLGRLDILVNNASIAKVKPMMELEEEDWDRLLATNVKGLFFALQAAARHMIGRGIRGSIVNLASIAGIGGRPALLPYAASKAAVISVTQSAALGLAPYGIRVNAVAPGTIDTPMWDQLATEMAACEGVPKEEVLRSRPVRIPLGRLASAEDVARAVLYLASDEAAYITGQTLAVCGGLSIG